MARYSSVERLDGSERIVELRDEATGSFAVIVPGIGGTCNRYVWEHQGAPLDVIVGAPDYETLRATPILFGNPILFPFPNRIRDGRFTFQGQEVSLPINEPERNTAIHGLVCDRPWDVAALGASDQEGAWVTLRFMSSKFPDVEAVFPFSFQAEYTYRLQDGALKNEFKAVNVGDRPMPMGFGVHPWFPAPFSDKGSRAACRVKAPVSGVWRLDERLMPTGEIDRPAAARDLAQDVPLAQEAYDDVYTGLNQGGPSEVVCTDPDTGVELAVQSDAGFRELVIYAPLDRDVVCLEPYTCVTDAFNLQARGIDAGVIVLEPGESWSGTIVYSPRPISR